MDNWKVDDVEGPDDLQLTKLSNLVDKYMEEDGGKSTPIIHHIQNHDDKRRGQHDKDRRYSTRKGDDKMDDNSGNTDCQYVDI